MSDLLRFALAWCCLSGITACAWALVRGPSEDEP